MIFRSSFSPLHGRATTHVNTSATFCSTRSYAGETPTCRTPSRACRPPSGSSSGHIFWTTPYSSVSRHARLRSRLSPRPRTSLCFLRPRGPPATLPARPALTLGTGNNSSNRSASLTGPRPLHANVSPSEARTAPSPNLPPGTSERGGRSIVPATSDHQLRVDTVSTDTPPRVAPMGPASRRPLCHFGNRPPAHVRLSTPGPGSVEDRRLVFSMDGSVGLHVSSLPAHSGGAPEDTGVQLPRRPSGPSVAVSTLVSPSTVSARRSSETPTSAADATAPTSVPDLSSGPVTPLSARLEAIKSALVSRGYSSTVATRITASHRLSTQSVYDSKWRIFTEWCRDTGHDPFSTSTPVLADFLAFLFTAKGFAPTTIAGYRTTIINTLEKVTGHRLADEHLISSLLNQFESERPRPGRSTPDWDLALVLRALHYAPFEPLAKAPLWALTFKTVFLTALASAKRRSGASRLLLPSSTPRRLVQRHLSSGPPLRGQDRARPAVQSPAYTTSTSRPLRLSSALTLRLTPTTAWSALLRSTSPAPRTSARGGKRLFIAYKPGHTEEIKAATISS